jgi:hypothetical protein
MKKYIIGAVIGSAIFLVGCGKTVEEQVTEGIVQVEASFEKAKESNTAQDDVKLYLPDGYVIDLAEEERNYIVSSDDDQYILFVNEKESEDSQVHYELVKMEKEENIIHLEQLKNEKEFGFAAVIKRSEEQYELIVSIGGIKLSTMTNDKKIDKKLANMMDIVRSVEIIK